MIIYIYRVYYNTIINGTQIIQYIDYDYLLMIKSNSVKYIKQHIGDESPVPACEENRGEPDTPGEAMAGATDSTAVTGHWNRREMGGDEYTKVSVADAKNQRNHNGCCWFVQYLSHITIYHQRIATVMFDHVLVVMNRTVGDVANMRNLKGPGST